MIGIFGEGVKENGQALRLWLSASAPSPLAEQRHVSPNESGSNARSPSTGMDAYLQEGSHYTFVDGNSVGVTDAVLSRPDW